MLHELRIYDVVPGRLTALNQRFANVTIAIWKKHGIKPVAFWTEEFGTSNRLVYLLEWESLADRDKKWATFQADTEWQQKRAESERDGPIVGRIENRILRPTPYSPLR
ncbi:MAG: NIPSNAP family protein [Chloroflexi bacterium]|nr:NIPSNAP family protein [Chloroflexota bacterium]